MSKLPIVEESVENARARFPLSIAVATNPLNVITGGQTSPSEMRQHVFDFADGIRLIITRDIIHDLLPQGIVHFSGSVHPYSLRRFLPIKFLLPSFIRRFMDISNWPGTIAFIGLTPDGIHHWVAIEIEEENANKQ